MITRKALFALAKTLGGVPVLGTLSGSPAERAGLRYGDILLAVNGQKTATIDDYVTAKALRSDAMEIVLFRSGVERVELLQYEAASGSPNAAAVLAELIASRILGADVNLAGDVDEPEGGDRS